MPRPITLFTGQWTDLPLADVARKAAEFGYGGLELAAWGDHLDVEQAASDDAYVAGRRDLLERHDLELFAIGAHRVGQAVLDRVDERHQRILPAHVWGDGDPAGVNKRAASELMLTARAAQRLGVGIVTAFCGSSISHYLAGWPHASDEQIDAGFKLFAERFHPILDTFAECGVQLALEVHPASLAFDLFTAARVLQAVDRREELGFNFDPGHFAWQGIDPVEFLRAFPDRILHVHLKDTAIKLNGRTSVLASYLHPGDPRRAWEFRTPGRGGIDFEEIIRALHYINYTGPLSFEWEDSHMDREVAAREACLFVQSLDFAPRQASADTLAPSR